MGSVATDGQTCQELYLTTLQVYQNKFDILAFELQLFLHSIDKYLTQEKVER